MRQSMFFTAFIALFVLIAPQAQAEDVTVEQLTGIWKGSTVNGSITEHWVINRQRTGRFKASRLYVDSERKIYARIMTHGTWTVQGGSFILKVKFENDRTFNVSSVGENTVDYASATATALQDTRTNAMILPAPPEGYKLVQQAALTSR